MQHTTSVHTHFNQCDLLLFCKLHIWLTAHHDSKIHPLLSFFCLVSQDPCPNTIFNGFKIQSVWKVQETVRVKLHLLNFVIIIFYYMLCMFTLTPMYHVFCRFCLIYFDFDWYICSIHSYWFLTFRTTCSLRWCTDFILHINFHL